MISFRWIAVPGVPSTIKPPFKSWANAAMPRSISAGSTLCSIYRGAIYRTSGFASRMDLRDVFAANLRRLRHAKGLSQDDLAYEARVSLSYLSQLEKGAFYASLKIVSRLAKALKVEPSELLKSSARR